MNREIKFRAWVFIDYYDMTPNEPHGTGVTVVSKWCMCEILMLNLSKGTMRVRYKKGGTTDVKIGNLMQFTGLQDKNGIDIYEGDVIRTPRGDWGVIVYKAPFFEVTVSSDQSSMYSREWFNDVEVIGNIHQNPDLL